MAVALVLAAIGGLLRFPGLDRVRGYYWDETFYAADAAAYLGRVPPSLRAHHPVPEVAENSWMQPPLGKWAIAAGEWTLGDNAWGWLCNTASTIGSRTSNPSRTSRATNVSAFS